METVNKNNLPQAIKDIPADEFQPLNTSTLKERERIATPLLHCTGISTGNLE